MADYKDLSKKITEFNIKKPNEIIFTKIKELIDTSVLKPGERLPSERELANLFNVSRGYVREAIKELEFNKIVKRKQQSGPIVLEQSHDTINKFISDISVITKNNLISVYEVWVLFEIYSAKLTIARATDSEIKMIKIFHESALKQGEITKSVITVDIKFHIKIAEFCKNPIIQYFINLLTPQVFNFFKNNFQQDAEIFSLEEHGPIVDNIIDRNPIGTEKIIFNHLNRIIIKSGLSPLEAIDFING